LGCSQRTCEHCRGVDERASRREHCEQERRVVAAHRRSPRSCRGGALAAGAGSVGTDPGSVPHCPFPPSIPSLGTLIYRNLWNFYGNRRTTFPKCQAY
uniref:Secreted protein n=1 Tax=Nippostrongylus brasiliensis TaxID=27835 RepID=A0A0N4Y656_NIPBR